MQKDQVQTIINEILQKGQGTKGKFHFIKHYSDFKVSPEFVKDSISGHDFCFFSHEFRSDVMQNVYEPFLDCIKEVVECSANVDVRDFVEQCDVYPLQLELLESYYSIGMCERSEDILLHELGYETTRMMDNMIHIFKEISQRQPIFILLNGIHYAHASTLRFLQYMIKHLADSDVYILGVYNGELGTDTYYVKEWAKFKKIIENKCNVVTRILQEKSREITQKELVLLTKDFDEYIVKINNMIEMGAYDQADYFLSLLYIKMKAEESSFSNEQHAKAYLLYLRNYVYLNDVGNALHISNEIKAKSKNNDECEKAYFMALYYIGIVEIFNHRRELVEKSIQYCRKIADKFQDDKLKLRVLILIHMKEFEGFSVQQARTHQDTCDEEFVELMKKYRFRNHLAYYYTKCMGNNLESVQKEGQEGGNEIYYETGLELASKIGNDNCILVFYNMRIFLASILGKFSYAERYFQKCMPLIAKSSDKADLCANMNGLGYVTCVNGEYQKSANYFHEALKVEKEEGNTRLMAETIYNISITTLLAKDYANAARYIDMATEIIEGMEYYAFPCNISKIYGLGALANYYADNDYRCHFYLEKMKRFIGHLLRSNDENRFRFWDDDMMLYYLMCGLVDKREGNYEEAVSNFLLSKKHLYNTPGFFFFGYPILAEGFYDCYVKMGRYEDADDLINEAIEKLENAKYVAEIPRLVALKNKTDYKAKEYNFELERGLEKEIQNLISQSLMRRVNKSLLSHSGFLSVWQDVINDKNTVEDVYENAYQAALNHFSADQMLIFSKQGENLELSYSFNDEKFSKEQLDILEKYAKLYPAGFVSSRMYKEFYLYKEIIEIFDFDKIVSFMMVPYIKDNVVAGVAILYIVMKEEFRKISSIFDNEGLVMFRVAYRQMVDLIEKIDANETIKKMNESLLYVNKKLEESVVTDTLTGIYNREGYITKVREIEESEEIKDCIVLYFDLDNFKYYNDTFGHDVGDLVLVQLAKILQFLAEDNGIPIRYGGDEFLLIVPEITIEQAEAIAKEFYNILKQREYFIPKIEQVLKKKVDIPEEKQISSSIGIARTDYKVGRNIEKTVSYADTSLYDVKKSKKKNYRIWTPKDV